MKIKVLFRSLLFLLFGALTIDSSGQADYPVPSKTDKLLFYFQRSHNKNTVVYELNTTPEGKVNIRKPVIAYWIRFEEGGIKKDLSFIQQRAFGISSRLTDKEKESFVLHFNNFKAKDISLLKSSNGIYKAFVKINGQYAELMALFIKSENNALGFPLKIKYIELKGIAMNTREVCTERITP
jgi:hypothetical protein